MYQFIVGCQIVFGFGLGQARQSCAVLAQGPGPGACLCRIEVPAYAGSSGLAMQGPRQVKLEICPWSKLSPVPGPG